MINRFVCPLVAAAFLTGSAVSQLAPSEQAVWVWPDPAAANEVNDAALRTQLIDQAAASAVTALFVSVYKSPPNPAAGGSRMYDHADIADLINQATSNGIDVWAVYGAPDWTDPDMICQETPIWPRPFTPLQLMQEVIDYNASMTSSCQFKGVVLDIEHWVLPMPEIDFELLCLYECIRQRLQPEGLETGVAINAFWDLPVEYPSGGLTKPLYQHILDMPLDLVVVLGYRDTALDSQAGAGIISIVQDEVSYADGLGRTGHLLLGLETMDCIASGACSTVESFFEEGQDSLNQEASLVLDHFADSSSLSGFAIHFYGDAYLVGAPDWPVENLEFPTARDSDEDGLTDQVELTIGTDPYNPDSDGDGLFDGTEVDMAEGSGCPDPLVPDSDSDGLLDGDDVQAGTDPCNPDSDADAIPDSVDPYPLDPGGTLSYIESELRALGSLIDGLPLSKIHARNDNAARGRRNAMSNRTEAAANAVAAGAYGEAIDQLESLRAKLDGDPQPKDWLNPCPERDEILAQIDYLLTLLSYMV